MTSSESQEGNGNGNLGDKFSRATRLPVIILTQTGRPSMADEKLNNVSETLTEEMDRGRLLDSGNRRLAFVPFSSFPSVRPLKRSPISCPDRDTRLTLPDYGQPGRLSRRWLSAHCHPRLGSLSLASLPGHTRLQHALDMRGLTLCSAFPAREPQIPKQLSE